MPYILKYRIVKNNKTIKYVISDSDTNKIVAKLTPEELKTRLKKGFQLKDVYLQNNKLSGKGLKCHIKSADTSNRATTQPTVITSPTSLVIWSGEALTKYVKREVSAYTPRSELNALVNDILKQPIKRVSAIYGLRRTGKTVLTLQAINYLITEAGIAPTDIQYLLAQTDTTAAGLIQYLSQVPANVKYIFIDEITAITGITARLNVLSDALPHKYILTGTDSFALGLSFDSSLFDRVDVVDTTILSYYDYQRLFNGSFEEYIHLGSLSDKFTKITGANVSQYISEAIVHNISESIRRNPTNIDDIVLTMSQEELKYYIMHVLITDTAQMGTINFLKGATPKASTAELSAKIKEEARRLTIQKVCGTNTIYEVNNTKISAVQRLLKILGVVAVSQPLLPVDVQYYTVLPAVHYQIQFIYDTLVQRLCEQYKCEVQLANTNGFILENLVKALLRKCGYVVHSYRNTFKPSCPEVDIVIYNAGKLYLFEVKSSVREDFHFKKHLNNPDVCADIEQTIIDSYYYAPKSVSKLVLYNGKTDTNSGFINIEDFLKQYIYNL